MSVTNKSLSMTTQYGKLITPFGAVEDPSVPQMKKGDIVLKIDTLKCLKDLWGANILTARQHVYKLVAGTVSDDEFQQLLVSYYRRYQAFANYVDEKYLFEEKDTPLVVRIIKPVRAAIDAYEHRLIVQCSQCGGTYLGNSHDYAYFSFKHENLPEFEESTRLC